MSQLLECVPNFSEGRDPAILRRIAEAISGVAGVKLLHVDPGAAAHRTVMTFAGPPEAVVEAAFRAIKVAGELIDLRHHHGEHPRLGATDVCPLIPLEGLTLDDAADWARRLGERVGRELALPVYLYEHAQPDPARRNLSVIRAGEYEGLAAKLQQPGWAPDYGPREFDARRGATVIGARDFLVAYNVNLNTREVPLASAIAAEVRASGQARRTADGRTERVPGRLPHVKAIGWFIAEYGCAQVSMNLTNYRVTPLHAAFDEVERAAAARGLRVTGSELIGLVPLAALLAAGRHYRTRQGLGADASEAELVDLAVRTLGLGELAPFRPEERVIEYRLRGAPSAPRSLTSLSLEKFAQEVASDQPLPGGGSVAAAVGSLGAALAAMVAGLSARKVGWEARRAEFAALAERGRQAQAQLLALVEADTAAYRALMAAYALPKLSAEEKAARTAAIQVGLRGATEVPLRTLRLAVEAAALAAEVAEQGNPNAASDAGVGALCARTAAEGAHLNVCTNLPGWSDRAAATELRREADELLACARAEEQRALSAARARLER